MKMSTKWSRTAAVLLGAGLLIGCTDPLSSAGRTPDSPETEELLPGITPILVITAQTATTITVELHLRRVEMDERIASFQGQLRFDAGTMSLDAAQIPQNITGAWNGTETGTVRFAGVALQGIVDAAILTLTFATSTPAEGAAFEIMMEEVIATEGFRDLTSSIRQRDPRAVLSRQP
jgi:hypothetical protein